MMEHRRKREFRAFIRQEDDSWELIQWNPDFFSDMSPVTGYGSEFPAWDDEDVVLNEWTNVTDQDDQKIFEDDVVMWKRRLHRVVFVLGAFGICTKKGFQLIGLIDHDVKVMGNIWTDTFPGEKIWGESVFQTPTGRIKWKNHDKK